MSKRLCAISIFSSCALFAASASAQFINASPVANAGGPYSIYAGNNLFLNGGWSTDPNLIDGDSITQYSWDFGNNGTYEVNQGAPTVIVTWATLVAAGVGPVGNYSLKLRVKDSFGAYGFDTTSLSVAQTSVVPEPEGYMLALGALGTILVAGRFRRT